MGNPQVKVHYTRSTDYCRATATVEYAPVHSNDRELFPYTAIDIDSLSITSIAVLRPDIVNGARVGHSTVFFESKSAWQQDEEYILEKALTLIELTEFFSV